MAEVENVTIQAPVGFVRDAQPTAAGIAAIAAKKDAAFIAPKRRMVTPSGADGEIVWGVVKPKAPIIPEGVTVRDLASPDVKLTAAEKGQRKGRQPKEKAFQLGLNQSILRTVGAQAPLRADEKKDIVSLPRIVSECIRDNSSAAFQAAKGQSNARIDMRFEGVRVGTIGEKDKMRVADPIEPTWYLYSMGQLYPQDHTFPMRSHIRGIPVARIQAAHVNNLIGAGVIDNAVYALPRGENEEFGKQWKHVPHLGTIKHVDNKGKVMPTMVTVAHEAKETKPDEPRYQVTYVMVTATGNVSRESWVNSEAQARKAAMDLLATGMVTTVTIIAPSKKPLDETKYPLSAGKSDHGRPIQCWAFDGISATLTRTGFCALEPDTIADPFVASRNRDKWIKRHPKHDKIWMKASSDTCSFSRG